MPESKIYSLAPTLSRPSNNDSGNFWIWRFAGFRGFVDRWFMGGRFKRDAPARKELEGLSLFAAQTWRNVSAREIYDTSFRIGLYGEKGERNIRGICPDSRKMLRVNAVDAFVMF